MKTRLSKILLAAEPDGKVDFLRELAQQAVDMRADAIALLGSLAPRTKTPKIYGDIFKTIAEPRLPVFYIPGPDDVPFSEFLREAAGFEVALPNIRGVHATFAMAPGHVIFAGMGGKILDESDCVRDQRETLHYPGWEMGYRLKFLKELKDYEKVFLFTSRPERKGVNEKGSSAVAEVVKTYNPRLVLVAGRERDVFTLGNSSVICPGSLAHGHFTLIDFGSCEAKPGILRDFVRAA
jgi:hypothetical protein